MSDRSKTSEQLEREIEARRARIENRVDDISARLSPGQMLDEALTYAKTGAGADFTRNLGQSVRDNPLPVALAGLGLGWLAIQSNLPKRETIYEDAFEDDRSFDHYDVDEDDYPVAVITGTSIKRIGSSEEEGNRFTEFADETGRKFKAMSDEFGHRAGHFSDETGKHFRGFIDESGHRISDFRDEAGNKFHRASGWATHNWRKAGEGVSRFGRKVGRNANAFGSNIRDGANQFGDNVREGAGYLGDRAHDAGHGLRRQGENAVSAADDFIHDQPLVSGAIAFAIGAILGGVLPHTRQEDKLFGKASDSVKRSAGHEAEKLYEKGREHAEDLHDQARDAVSHAYDDAKDAVRSAADAAEDAAHKPLH